MNKYFGVNFRKKGNNDENIETFIVSQDLVKRGAVEKLFVKINSDFVEMTNGASILEWVQLSDDKKIYDENYNKIELNDIPFDDYIKVYNSKEQKIGQFIIEKYMTFKNERCILFLSMKTDDLDNKIFCEYYNKTSKEFIYTERVLGLDRVIQDEQLKEKIKKYFEDYKKENL